MMKKTCPNCQSTQIIPNADAVETNNLSIRIYEQPGVSLKGMRHYPFVSLRPIMVQGFHPRRARCFRPKGATGFHPNWSMALD